MLLWDRIGLLDELLFDDRFCRLRDRPGFLALKLIPLPLILLVVRLDPQFALFANLISHGTASERERSRSRRRLRPQKFAEYWRKTEGTFDCQASLVFGRRRTSKGGKGTDVRPAGRVHPGEAVTDQKQGKVDGKRSAIGISDQRLMIVGGPGCAEGRFQVDLALP